MLWLRVRPDIAAFFGSMIDFSTKEGLISKELPASGQASVLEHALQYVPPSNGDMNPEEQSLQYDTDGDADWLLNVPGGQNAQVSGVSAISAALYVPGSHATQLVWLLLPKMSE